MSPIFTFLSDLTEWIFWKTSQIAVGFLPWRWLYLASEPLSWIYFVSSVRRRYQMQRVLKSHFGSSLMKYDVNKLVFESYRELCKFQIESLLYPQLNKNNVNKIAKIRGFEHLDQALNQGNGVILLLSHFGNNEIIMPVLGYHGYKINQIADRHPPRNLKDAARKTSVMRVRNLSLRFKRQDTLPCKFIPARGSPRDAVRALQKKEILMVTGDGRIGKKYLEFPFLNARARFLTGPIKLGIKYGAPIFPVFTLRNKNNISEIIIEKQINADLEQCLDEETKVKHCLSNYASMLERYVMSYPAHYAKYLWQMSLGVRRGDVPMFVGEDDTQ